MAKKKKKVATGEKTTPSKKSKPANRQKNQKAGKPASKTTKKKATNTAKKKSPVKKARKAVKKTARKTAKKAPRKKRASKKKSTALPTQPVNRRGKLSTMEAVAPRAIEALNPNWVAVAGFNNTGGPITSFVCTMQVPPPIPFSANHGQSILLFIGLQSPDLTRIVQPILQFGESQMGGGPFWSIGSCLARNEFELEEHKGMERVNEGARVKAVIQLASTINNRFTYRCFFEDGDGPISGTEIHTAPIGELTNACVTLEAIHVGAPGDYGPIRQTIFSDIIVRNSNGIIVPPWQMQAPGPRGEHPVLRRVPGEPDDIEIHFSQL